MAYIPYQGLVSHGHIDLTKTTFALGQLIIFQLIKLSPLQSSNLDLRKSLSIYLTFKATLTRILNCKYVGICTNHNQTSMILFLFSINYNTYYILKKEIKLKEGRAILHKGRLQKKKEYPRTLKGVKSSFWRQKLLFGLPIGFIPRRSKNSFLFFHLLTKPNRGLGF